MINSKHWAISATDNKWLRIFVWSVTIAIAIDLLLVICGFTSISMTSWILTQLHPTLIAFGILCSCWVALKIRKFWKPLFFWGIIVGHLFVHWAVLICFYCLFSYSAA